MVKCNDCEHPLANGKLCRRPASCHKGCKRCWQHEPNYRKGLGCQPAVPKEEQAPRKPKTAPREQKQASPKRASPSSALPLFEAYQQLVNDAKDADTILERLKKTHPKKARNFEASAHENAHARVEGAIRDIAKYSGYDEAKLKSPAAIKKALQLIASLPGDAEALRSDFESQHEYYGDQVMDFMQMHNIPYDGAAFAVVDESSIKQMPMLPHL